MTGGGDGNISFWDKDKKSKLKDIKLPPLKPQGPSNPVTAAAWNAGGDLFAYAGGYDWQKGVEGYAPAAAPAQLFVHWTTANDLKVKK
jgi:WD40 repeat protein